MTPRALPRTKRQKTARTLFAFCALLGAGCRSRSAGVAPLEGNVDGGVAASPPSATSSHATSSSRAPMDTLGSIYPRNLPPHPKAVELCDALHGVAARRKAECCGGEPLSFFATECARVLGATLHASTVEIDETSVDRCLSAVNEGARSCDSVTPAPAPLPAACRGLLRGKLASGKACRSSLECEGNLHCEGVSPTRTGVCTPPGAVGAGCGVHVDVLASYMGERDLATSHPFCADFCSLAAHKCGPVPAAGTSCLATVNCAPGQVCVARKCSAAPLAARGEGCSTVPCEAGLRCVSSVCEPLARTGEDCRSDEDCETGGCAEGDDGRSVCGAKCSASLGILRRPDGGPAMRLPRARRTEPGAR